GPRARRGLSRDRQNVLGPCPTAHHLIAAKRNSHNARARRSYFGVRVPSCGGKPASDLEPTMTTQTAQAAYFHALHENLLILANAWDGASARVIKEAGALAVAT